jgi:hypothetical protein
MKNPEKSENASKIKDTEIDSSHSLTSSSEMSSSSYMVDSIQTLVSKPQKK